MVKFFQSNSDVKSLKKDNIRKKSDVKDSDKNYNLGRKKTVIVVVNPRRENGDLIKMRLVVRFRMNA